MALNKSYWIIRSLLFITQLTFLSSINFSNAAINPCDNFYDFSCLNHINNTNNSKSLVAQAQEHVIENIKRIINEIDYSKDVIPLKMLKRFYNTCMNADNAQAIEIIKSVLQSLGGWSLISETKNLQNLNYEDLLLFYSKLNVFPFYEILTHYDNYNNKNKILIRQPTTVSFTLQNGANKYINFIKKIAKSLNDLKNDHELQKKAEEIVSFEAALSKILLPKDVAVVYQLKLLKHLNSSIDIIAANVNVKLNITSNIHHLYLETTTHINVEDEVDVASLDYYPKLIKLLQNTSADTIVNYIHWKFVLHFLPFMDNKLKNLYSEVKSILPNPVKELSRSSMCVSESAFDFIIAYQYAKNYITTEVENSASEIIKNIKEAAIEIIKDSSLLNKKEKEVAKGIVINMKFVLGIPNSLKQLSKLLEFYNNLPTLGNNYFENILTLRRFSKIKELEKVKKNSLINTTYANVIKVTNFEEPGSFYDFLNNIVYIKVENLETPLFDTTETETKKYGILGYIIARNIMNAFQEADSVAIYNSGNFTKLYSDETKEKYWDKMMCFITQFSNIKDYLKQILNINDMEPSIYNIGDTAAIQIALKAYHKNKQGLIANENYKEFFALYANLLCRPELVNFDTKWVAHLSKSEYRVMGSLPNIEEFAEAYDCPIDSRMNVKNKCTFWN